MRSFKGAIAWLALTVACQFLLPPEIGRLLWWVLLFRAVWFVIPAWRRPHFRSPGSPEDRQLESICAALLPMFDNIPAPAIRLSPGERFLAVHGAREGPSVQAHYDPNRHRIEMNSAWYSRLNWPERVDVVKHELVHAWLHVRRVPHTDPHGPEFQAKARAVGLRE
jgi:hypothetical protein